MTSKSLQALLTAPVMDGFLNAEKGLQNTDDQLNFNYVSHEEGLEKEINTQQE